MWCILNLKEYLGDQSEDDPDIGISRKGFESRYYNHTQCHKRKYGHNASKDVKSQQKKRKYKKEANWAN